MLLKNFHKDITLILNAHIHMQYMWDLISLVTYERVNLHMINVVTTYLYQFIDNDICMKLTKGYNLPSSADDWEDYPIKLIKSLD